MSDIRDKVERALWETKSLSDFIDAAIAIVLEEAARVVTEHYQELSTEHRLLLLNRVAAIRALAKK